MFFVVQSERDELTRWAGLAEDGRLRPIVRRTFALADGRRAYESGSQSRLPGKTSLIP